MSEEELELDGECERCGETMLTRAGDDPTPNCDHCAHELVAELADANKGLRLCIDKREAEYLAALAELDEATAWIRVVGEEMILAGYPAGDRTVTLANTRRMIEANKELLAALKDAYQLIPDPDYAAIIAKNGGKP